MKDISKGYIALYRQFMEWEWFTDINTCHLFIYCLLRANHKNTKWRGIELKKGQFVTSLRNISADTGLSLQQVRTSIKKLTHGLTSELTHVTTNQYSIITVKNYKLYQEGNTRNNTQPNNQITTDNKLINNSNISYINISLSIEERENLKKYIIAKKKNVHDADAYIRKLIDNGDINIILERARKWKEKQEVKNELNNRLFLEEDDPFDTEEKRMEAQRKAHEIVKNLGRKKR